MEDIIPDGEPAQAVITRLRSALRDFTGNADVDNLSDDAPLMEALESLGHFTFLLTLEETFGVEIADHRFTVVEMGTLAGIASVLAEASPATSDPSSEGSESKR